MATTKTRTRARKNTVKPAAKAEVNTKPALAPQQSRHALSIALPTWNNASILWLQLEALLRQETKHSYEVIVLECPVSGGYQSEELVLSYTEKFAERGAELRYIQAPKRTPLIHKWRAIAQAAATPYLLMVASDNYTPAFAVEAYIHAFEKGHNWIDCPSGVFYDIRSRKLAEFRTPEGRTGVLFATHSEAIAALPDHDEPRNLDGFIYDHVPHDNRAHVEFPDGILTDGYNTISHHRAAKYAGLHRRPPFYDIDCTLYDRLPADIAARLEKMKPIVVG